MVALRLPLPIFRHCFRLKFWGWMLDQYSVSPGAGQLVWHSTGGRPILISSLPQPRSEERRVGKECRSRWSAYHFKKKTAGSGVQRSLEQAPRGVCSLVMPPLRSADFAEMGRELGEVGGSTWAARWAQSDVSGAGLAA